MNYRFLKYEGWSVNNTRHHLNLSEGENVIFLISDEDIDEVSFMGLHKLVEDRLNIFQGLDVEACISKGYYDATNDRISHKFANLPYIFNASKYLEDYNKDLLDNAKSIACIYYSATARYDKTKVWKFLNKKKSIVNTHLDDI